MAVFQPTLTQRDVNIPVTAAPVDTTGAATVRALGSVVGAGIDIGNKVIDSRFADELASGGDEKNLESLQQQKTAVARSVADAEDVESVDNLTREFRKLEDAERSRKISLQTSALRKDAILKTYINKYPWRASSFRSIAAGQAGRAAQASLKIDKTPEEKALETLRIGAAEHKMSVGRYAESQRLATEKTLQINRGALVIPEVEDSIIAQAGLARMSFLSQFTKEAANNPEGIDGVDWQIRANSLKQGVIDEIYSEKARLARHGVLLEGGDINALVGRVNDEFAFLDEISKSKDKARVAASFKTILEARGSRSMDAMFPGIAQILPLMGPEQASKIMFDIVPEINNKLRSGVSRQQMDLLVSENPQSRIIWNGILSGQVGPEAVKDLGNPEVRDEAFTLYKKKIASDIIASPTIGVTEDIKQKSHAELISSEQSEELEYYLKPQIFSETIKDSSAVKKLNERITNNTVQIVSGFLADKQARESFSPDLDYATAGAIDVDISSLDTYDLEFSNGKFSTTKVISNTSLVKDLNMFYKLNRKYGFFETSEQSWIDEVLTKVNTDFVTTGAADKAEATTTIPVDSIKELPEDQQRQKMKDAGFQEEDIDAAIEHLKGKASPDVSKLEAGTYLIDGELVEIA